MASPARRDRGADRVSRILEFNQPLESENMKFFKKFRTQEDGAVTVDWVVLTAAIVGLGVAVMTTVRGGTEGLAGKISSGLATMTTN